MAFVTSRAVRLPESAEEMTEDLHFHLWTQRLRPYRELGEGDDLYWYEGASQAIVWRTRVRRVETFAYDGVEAAVDQLEAIFGQEVDREQAYLDDKADTGYCLAYQVDAMERVHLPKPPNLRFNRQGWEYDDNPEIADWLTARSKSGGNPTWARDEIVLALELFVRAGSVGGNPMPGKTDARVVELSKQLASLPLHPPARRGSDFRNPTGVAMKLANLRAIDRDLALERGDPGADSMPHGMTSYGNLDRAVFEEFYDEWDRLTAEAAAILSAAEETDESITEPKVVTGPVEESWTETFHSAPTAGGARTRREGALVKAYAAWLEEQGHKVERQSFTVPGETRPLVCDAYVPDLKLLVEAKANASRNSVRLAIGQLMDYRRFTAAERLAVLLPHEPPADLRDLLRSVGVEWIWCDKKGRFYKSSAR